MRDTIMDKSETVRDMTALMLQELTEVNERIRGVQRQLDFTRRLLPGAARTQSMDHLEVAEVCIGNAITMAERFLNAQVIGLRDPCAVLEILSDQGGRP